MTHMHKLIVSAIAVVSLSAFAQTSPGGNATSGTNSGSSSGTYMGTGTTSGTGSDTSVSNPSSNGMRTTGSTTSATGDNAATPSPTGDFTSDPATVRQVQQALIDRGHDVGRVDGIYGTRTQQALRSFQSDQGITTSGSNLLDAQTMAALGVSQSSMSAPTGTQRNPATTVPSDTSTRQGRSPGTDMIDDDDMPADSTNTQDRGVNPGQR